MHVDPLGKAHCYVKSASIMNHWSFAGTRA
jgi:hypothetical protein